MIRPYRAWLVDDRKTQAKAASLRYRVGRPAHGLNGHPILEIVALQEPK